MLTEKQVTPCVVSLLIRMLGSINLDNHPGRKTRKISHIRPERMLPAELDTQLLATQPLP